MSSQSSEEGGGRNPPSSASCACERPLAQQQADYKGGGRTVCARCGLPVPLRLGRS
jgi:hypothetical protein